MLTSVVFRFECNFDCEVLPGASAVANIRCLLISDAFAYGFSLVELLRLLTSVVIRFECNFDCEVLSGASAVAIILCLLISNAFCKRF